MTTDSPTPRLNPIENAGDAEKHLPSLRQYRKIASWLLLKYSDLPTLDGLVVTKMSAGVVDEAARFAARRGWPGFLIRSDRSLEVGSYPRGGYVVQARDIGKELANLIGQGRVVFLLEPLSPFNDLYSLNIAFWTEDPFISVEVVGPGFDASDLKRGDLTPHESIHVPRGPSGRFINRMERTVVSDDAYQTSVTRRLVKVGRLIARSDGGTDDTLEEEQWIEIAERGLSRRGETLLLEHRSSYPAVDLGLVERAIGMCAGLPTTFARHGFPGEPYVVSMTYFGRDARPVYWDVVWPHLKYEGMIRPNDL